MKRFLILTLAAVLSALSFSKAAAFTPEMAKKDLWKNSNTIVKGRVVDVRCTGEIIEEFCATLIGYRATVQVDSILKGEPYSTINLHFYKYDYNYKCFGTDYTRHYKDEEAIYYLNCDKHKRCRFTNWNGIEYIKRSSEPLPKCGFKNKRKKR